MKIQLTLEEMCELHNTTVIFEDSTKFTQYRAVLTQASKRLRGVIERSGGKMRAEKDGWNVPNSLLKKSVQLDMRQEEVTTLLLIVNRVIELGGEFARILPSVSQKLSTRLEQILQKVA